MSKTIAIFGGSLNPPHNGHVELARFAEAAFGTTHEIPCGARPDKLTVADIDPVHRAAMADLAFRDLPDSTVCLDDLERGEFTRTIDLDRKYRALGFEPWHVIGSEFIVGGDKAEMLTWRDGPSIWRDLNWAIVERPGYSFTAADLPPHAKVIGKGTDGRSTDIRSLIFNRQPFRHLVPSAVADYIERYGLFRGTAPVQVTHHQIAHPRALLVVDTRNPKAVALAEHFRSIEVASGYNCVVVIGGDGAMLHAIKSHWRKRLPFYGINAGHEGFLLNDHDASVDPTTLLREIKICRQSMFHVETEHDGVKNETSLAFNDAWIDHSTGQTAWVEIKVNGETRIPCLKGDMVVVASPAGSTAYAKNAGGPLLCVDMPAMVMAASCVQEPFGWRPVILPISSVIEITALDPVKRPIKGFVDGREIGPITKMTIRPSRTAAAELAFTPGRDMAAKLARYQFPTF